LAKVQQRTALATLPKARLVQLADEFELDIEPREPHASFVDRLARSKRASFEKILDRLTDAELKKILEEHNVQHDGGNGVSLRQLILGYEMAEGDVDPRRSKRHDKGLAFELAFKGYMEGPGGFRRVEHRIQCKGKVSDRSYECDLHGVKYSLVFTALYVVGIVVFLLAALAFVFPDDMDEVKRATDAVVASVNASWVEYSLAITAVVSWIVAYVGQVSTQTHVWVECKNQRGAVKREDVNKLHTSVEDVRALRGAKWKPDEVWLASTTKLDQDALNIAAHHGIRCFLVTDGAVEELDTDL
jgi:hypothetical protein